MGPRPITATVSPRLRRGLFKTAHHAGQRLHQRGVVIADVLRNQVSIALDDARGNANVLRVRAVVEEQVFAEILQPAAAEIALFARRRVGSDHALAHGKIGDALAHGDNVAGQFMPEHSGRDDHPRVISTAENLHIGTAGQRHLHPHQDVSRIDFRHGYRLHLQVFLAVKHGSHHVVVHYDHLCG